MPTTPYVKLPTADEIDSELWVSIASFAAAETITHKMAINRILDKTMVVMARHGINDVDQITDEIRDEVVEGFVDDDEMRNEELSPLLHWMIGYIHEMTMRNKPHIMALPQSMRWEYYKELFTFFMYGMSAGWSWYHNKKND